MLGQKVTFAAVGDIMSDNGVPKSIERKGPDFPFLNVASELRNADIVLGNLENPLTICQEKVTRDSPPPRAGDWAPEFSCR